MRHTFIWVLARLCFAIALSSIAAPLWITKAQAHEVLPTIADLSVTEDGAVQLDLRVNLEAFLAGIDLDEITDTNTAARAEDYDALRALPADQLAARVPPLVAEWSAHPILTAGGQRLALDQVSLTVPEGVDIELPRVAELSLGAEMPDGAQSLVVNWPDGSGALVLRQQGPEEPYTGYLNGGESSPEIAVGGGGAQTGWQALAT